jgi:hypothetical protein
VTKEWLQDSRTQYGCKNKESIENVHIFSILPNEPNRKLPLAPTIETDLFKIEYFVRAFIQVNNLWDTNRQGKGIEFPVIILGQSNALEKPLQVDPQFQKAGNPMQHNLVLDNNAIIPGVYDKV